MPDKNYLRILFVINPRAGNYRNLWNEIILEYFKPLRHTIELYEISKKASSIELSKKIADFLPKQIIAVGGDGTVRLVAECVFQKNIPIGIIPTGSANGLAKELHISTDPIEALDIITKGEVKKIHATIINNYLCIHLSDIGLNAYAIKKFDKQQTRGFWGYLIASLKVLWKNPRMTATIQLESEQIKVKAEIIVIANATQYGSGAIINPIGKIDDEYFEVIVVKKIALSEIFKMTVTHQPYDVNKIQIFQTKNIYIKSNIKVHFQVDGEYMGKVNVVTAKIIPNAIDVIVPTTKNLN